MSYWQRIWRESEQKGTSTDSIYYAMKNHKGLIVKNPDSGLDIIIASSGIKHVKSLSGDIRKAMLLYALPEIIEKGKYRGTEPDYHPEQRIKQIHRFDTAAKIGDDNVVIHSVVRETADGKFFYDYRLSDIEKESDGISGVLESLEPKAVRPATDSSNRIVSSGDNPSKSAPKLKRDSGVRLTLPDQEVQERIENARGAPRDSLLDGLKELLDEIVRKGHREFEHLPRTGEFSELRNSLLNLRKQKGITADETLRTLRGIVKPMNEQEYDVFTHKVIFDDLAQELEAGHMLPFGLTKENFEDNYSYVNEEAAKLPKVTEAVQKRKDIWTKIKDQYIEVQQVVGFNMEEKLKKEDYYHHQVLEHANKKGLMGSGKKLRIATGRGFLKKRGGSSFDINSDYLQAEFEVMAQMLMGAEWKSQKKRTPKTSVKCG